MAGRKKITKATGKKAAQSTQSLGMSKEISAVIVIAMALLFGVFYYMPSTGYLGDKLIKPFSLGVLGVGAYIVPPVLLFIGIHLIIHRKTNEYRSKYILFSFLPLIIGIFANIIAFKDGDDMGITEFYTYGMNNTGGGFFSALITVPLIHVIGLVASIILFLAIITIIIIYAFNFSFIDAFKKISDAALNKRHQKDAENAATTPAFDKQKRADEFAKIVKGIKEMPDEIEQISVIPDEPTIKIYGVDNKKESDSKKSSKESAKVKEDGIIISNENDFIDYKYPVMDLLSTNPAFGKQGSTEDLKKNAKKLVETLASFGVEVKVLNIERGPAVTRYEVQPSTGVKVSKITNLADDIALNLAARGVRIEAPIPGKAAVGIEVPNKEVTTVYLKDVLDTDVFRSCPSKVAFALGKDISGNTILADIAKMPHLLIAGATGSGKSVCINTLISSILFKSNPNEVKLLMIDPKMVELGVYNGIPHLLIPVVTDPKKAAGALNWAVSEMLNRYKLFAESNVRDLRGYNQIQLEKEDSPQLLPQILIIIDELADLMMASPHEVEDAICRLAQLARAAGMHLIIATQRPSVDVITGVIKANIPSRISFSVSSQVDSRTILDMAGAEKLLGKGDMLYFPIGEIKPIRLQGAFVSDKEVEKIVNFIRTNGEALYDEEIIEHIENGTGAKTQKESDDGCDAFLNDAIELVVNNGEASVSLIQRKFRVGYARAARIVDQMEDRGIVSPPDGSKPRKVLISKMEYNEMLMNSSDDNSKSVED